MFKSAADAGVRAAGRLAVDADGALCRGLPAPAELLCAAIMPGDSFEAGDTAGCCGLVAGAELLGAAIMPSRSFEAGEVASRECAGFSAGLGIRRVLSGCSRGGISCGASDCRL